MWSVLGSSRCCCQRCPPFGKGEAVTCNAVSPVNVVSTKIIKTLSPQISTLFLSVAEIPVRGGGGRVGCVYSSGFCSTHHATHRIWKC